MNQQEEKICALAEQELPEMFRIACDIFDHPELGLQEFYSSNLLETFLEEKGFKVERGIAGIQTAFRATWENGSGGPAIGFLLEYDALAGLGHGCAHHMQGPVCIGAALALREALKDYPFKLVLYGTPDEERGGGKITMTEAGCFRDVDVMLGHHAGQYTSSSYSYKALLPVHVVFHGTPAHASGSPELGRSALDAMMLAFHACEIMREHVKQGCRIHYTIREGTGPSNIVHEKAVCHITLRSPDKPYLEDMYERLERIINGACLMTDTTADITPLKMYWNMLPIPSLIAEILRRAEEIGAPHIRPAELRDGGSSDVGNVSWIVPTAAVYTYFCDAGAHSETWVSKGAAPEAEASILNGIKIMALTASTYITQPEKIRQLKVEHTLAMQAD